MLQLEQSTVENSDLKSRLLSATNRSEDLSQQVKATNQSLIDAVAAKDGEIIKFNEEIRLLRQKLTQEKIVSEESQRELRRCLTHKEEEVSSLTETQKSMDEDLSRISQSNKTLIIQLDEMKNKIRAMSVAAEEAALSSRLERQKLLGELQELENLLKTEKDAVEIERRRCKELAIRIEELSWMLRRSEEEASESKVAVHAELKEVKKELDSRTKMLECLQNEMNEYKERDTQNVSALKTLQSRNSELVTSFGAKESELAQLRTFCQSLQGKIAVLESQRSEDVLRLSQSRLSDALTAEGEREALQAALRKSSNEKAALLDRLTSLENSLGDKEATLRRQMDRTDELFSQLEAVNAEKLSSMAKLHSDNIALTTQLTEKAVELDSIGRRLEEKSEEIFSLRLTLAEKDGTIERVRVAAEEEAKSQIEIARRQFNESLKVQNEALKAEADEERTRMALQQQQQLQQLKLDMEATGERDKKRHREELEALRAQLGDALSGQLESERRLLKSEELHEDLKKQQIQFEASLTEMRNLLSSYSSICQEKENETAVLQQRLQESAGQVAQKEDELKQLAARELVQRKEIADLRTLLSQVESDAYREVKTAHERMEGWQKQMAAVLTEASDRSAIVHRLQQSLDDQKREEERKLNELKEETERRVEKERQIAELSKRELTMQLRDRQDEIGRLETQLKEQGLACSDYERRLIANQSESSQLKEQLSSANLRLADLQHKLSEELAEKVRVAEKFANDGKVSEQLLADLRLRLAAKATECEQAERQLSRLRTQLNEASSVKLGDIEKTQTLVTDMRKLLSQKDDQISALTHSCDNLRADLSNIRLREKTLQAMLAQEKEALKTLQQKKDDDALSQQERDNDSNRRIDALNRELQIKNSKLAQSEIQLKDTKEAMAALSEDRQQLQDSLDSYSQVVRDTKESLAQLVKDKQQLQESLLKSENAERQQQQEKATILSHLAELQSALRAKANDLTLAQEQTKEMMQLLAANTRDMRALGEERAQLLVEVEKARQQLAEMMGLLSQKANEVQQLRLAIAEMSAKKAAEVEVANEQVAKLFSMLAEKRHEAIAVTSLSGAASGSSQTPAPTSKESGHHQIHFEDTPSSSTSSSARLHLQQVRQHSVHEVSANSSSDKIAITPVRFIFCTLEGFIDQISMKLEFLGNFGAEYPNLDSPCC